MINNFHNIYNRGPLACKRRSLNSPKFENVKETWMVKPSRIKQFNEKRNRRSWRAVADEPAKREEIPFQFLDDGKLKSVRTWEDSSSRENMRIIWRQIDQTGSSLPPKEPSRAGTQTPTGQLKSATTAGLTPDISLDQLYILITITIYKHLSIHQLPFLTYTDATSAPLVHRTTEISTLTRGVTY